MRFGTKISVIGTLLWFHDREGAALFGILSGNLPDLEGVSKDKPLELAVSRPGTGWGPLTLTGDDLAGFLGLLPLARRAFDEAA